MHSTKPVHTCSDIRMQPDFITLTGWKRARAKLIHSTVRISGPPEVTATVCSNCPMKPSSAHAKTW